MSGPCIPGAPPSSFLPSGAIASGPAQWRGGDCAVGRLADIGCVQDAAASVGFRAKKTPAGPGPSGFQDAQKEPGLETAPPGGGSVSPPHRARRSMVVWRSALPPRVFGRQTFLADGHPWSVRGQADMCAPSRSGRCAVERSPCPTRARQCWRDTKRQDGGGEDDGAHGWSPPGERPPCAADAVRARWKAAAREAFLCRELGGSDPCVGITNSPRMCRSLPRSEGDAGTASPQGQAPLGDAARRSRGRSRGP
jgi:hypothetical protein